MKQRRSEEEGAAASKWCFDKEGEVLLPGLNNDTALRCLAFVPPYLYPLLASLNKTYHHLIISAGCAPLMHLRLSLGLVDHLLISQHPKDFREFEIVHINGQAQMRMKIKWSFRVMDIKRNTWMTLTVPSYISWHEYDTFFSSGTRLFCFSYSLANVGIHYDFANHKWEVCPRMIEPTRRWCAFATDGDCCFIAGGHKTNGFMLSMGEVLNSAEMYDLGRSTWHRLPCMPVARHACAGFIMDKKFYVIGGTDDRGYRRLVDAEEYDPSTEVWRTIHGMCLCAANQRAPLVAVHNNQLYAIDDKASSPLNPTLHIYEKQTNTWRSLGPVLDKHGEGNLRIRNEGLVSMGHDKLLVVGEWWPRAQGDEKKMYLLSWETSPEATACEFKIIYSRQADQAWFNTDHVWDFLEPQEERHLRLHGPRWLTVII